MDTPYYSLPLLRERRIKSIPFGQRFHMEAGSTFIWAADGCSRLHLLFFVCGCTKPD